MLTLLTLALAATCPTVEPRRPAPAHHLESRVGAVAGSGAGALDVRVCSDEGDQAAAPGVDIALLGPDGVVRTLTSDPSGRARFDQLPTGLYTLAALDHPPITVGAIQVVDGQSGAVTVRIPGAVRFDAPPPGPPPAPGVWLRYGRSGCLGPCASFEVTVDADGQVTFEGPITDAGGLSRRRQAHLHERVACAETLPSFAAVHATDHTWTRLEVWQADGGSWSWVWYDGDFRAPNDVLERYRRTLERALGIRRGTLRRRGPAIGR